MRHSHARITLGVYGHVLVDAQRRANDRGVPCNLAPLSSPRLDVIPSGARDLLFHGVHPKRSTFFVSRMALRGARRVPQSRACPERSRRESLLSASGGRSFRSDTKPAEIRAALAAGSGPQVPGEKLDSAASRPRPDRVGNPSGRSCIPPASGDLASRSRGPSFTSV